MSLFGLDWGRVDLEEPLELGPLELGPLELEEAPHLEALHLDALHLEESLRLEERLESKRQPESAEKELAASLGHDSGALV